jgi:hypothetical protein
MNDTRRLIDVYRNDTTLEDCVVELARQKRELTEKVKKMEMERSAVVEAVGT